MDKLLGVFDKNTKNVFINKKGVEEITFQVATYLTHNYNNKTFDEVTYNYVRLSTEFHPKKDDPKVADWLFVLNTLNFSLWMPKGESEWTVDGLTGYMALCAAIKRAIIDERKPMWKPQYYSTLSMADMRHIFRGDNHNIIPNISRRLVILHNVGKHLLEKYEGTFVKCIQSCKGDPQKLMDLLQNEFTSYENKIDRIDSEETVSLQSKAWILIADMWAIFRDHEFSLNITYKFPTIFVDYRVLQVLNHFNAIIYSKDFLDKLQKENEMTHGSCEDLEIRTSATMVINCVRIKMVEMFKNFVKSMPELQFKSFDFTCLIDNFLWDYQQLHKEQLKKYPLCKILTEQY